MAEIKIQKKKQQWPWLLFGLVVATLLIYFIVFRDNDKKPETVNQAAYFTNSDEPSLVGEKENETVAAYVNFVENSNEKMSLDHAYTNEALLKLVEATNAMANEVAYDVRADIEKVNEYAKMITNDPLDTKHADYIRKAADLLTKVLHNIQKANFPALADEVEALKSAATSIKPAVLTLDQKDTVKNYFAKAADLLKKMNK